MEGYDRYVESKPEVMSLGKINASLLPGPYIRDRAFHPWDLAEIVLIMGSFPWVGSAAIHRVLLDTKCGCHCLSPIDRFNYSTVSLGFRLRGFRSPNSDLTDTLKGSMAVGDGHKTTGDLGIREYRRSFALLCPLPPAYLDRNASNNDYLILRFQNYFQVDELKTRMFPGEGPGLFGKRAHAIVLCGPATGLTGVTVFQRVIWTEIENWAEDWCNVLSSIDRQYAPFQVIPLFSPVKM